ncbi:MAG: hypothetical protein ILO42_07490 [Clostridia bacterium]|nr:hypothetical protein [Clostridia bacterium]
MNRNEYGNQNYSTGSELNNAFSGNSLYDKLFDMCCSVAAFFMRPAIRWIIRFLTGAGVTVGVFFLARAWLGGTLGFIGGLLVAAALTFIGCVGISED